VLSPAATAIDHDRMSAPGERPGEPRLAGGAPLPWVRRRLGAGVTGAPWQVLLSYWTGAGPVPVMPAPELLPAGERRPFPLPAGQPSPFRLEDRIAAAAAAGFTGIGLLYHDLLTFQGGYARLRRLLDLHGITTVQLEWLNLDGPARDPRDPVRVGTFRAAGELGADHVKVGAEGGGPVDWDIRVAEFEALCAQAQVFGTGAAIEPMRVGSITTLAQARKLVDGAGHPAGGIIIDLYHMARGCVSGWDELAALPARYIKGVELCDADRDVVGSVAEDMWRRRRLCGDGDQDVKGFIRALIADRRDGEPGYRGAWGIEVLSDAHRRLPLAMQAHMAYSTTRAALDRAAAGAGPREPMAARA
jgi:sugar phosphate isomerase/epimerase